jgi:hypothetical protein
MGNLLISPTLYFPGGDSVSTPNPAINDVDVYSVKTQMDMNNLIDRLAKEAKHAVVVEAGAIGMKLALSTALLWWKSTRSRWSPPLLMLLDAAMSKLRKSNSNH